jgi:hypothetical protein
MQHRLWRPSIRGLITATGLVFTISGGMKEIGNSHNKIAPTFGGCCKANAYSDVAMSHMICYFFRCPWRCLNPQMLSGMWVLKNAAFTSFATRALQ